MLSNAYFLAKFRFDTAENEPTKNLQNFRKMHFSKIYRYIKVTRLLGDDAAEGTADELRTRLRNRMLGLD